MVRINDEVVTNGMADGRRQKSIGVGADQWVMVGQQAQKRAR